MAPDMKYSFVEMRTAEIATAAIVLDKVELCGRALNVGRPAGYVPAAVNPLAPSPQAYNAMMGQMAVMAAMAGNRGRIIVECLLDKIVIIVE